MEGYLASECVEKVTNHFVFMREITAANVVDNVTSFLQGRGEKWWMSPRRVRRTEWLSFICAGCVLLVSTVERRGPEDC